MDIHQALKILNLSPQVAQKEIKQAYRAMAKEWHPDRFLDPDEKSKAEEKIKEINQAYTLLKNYTGTVENNDTSPSDRASSEQKASIRNKSRDPDSWYQIACDYYQKGQSSEAIEACTQANCYFSIPSTPTRILKSFLFLIFLLNPLLDGKI